MSSERVILFCPVNVFLLCEKAKVILKKRWAWIHLLSPVRKGLPAFQGPQLPFTGLYDMKTNSRGALPSLLFEAARRFLFVIANNQGKSKLTVLFIFDP